MNTKKLLFSAALTAITLMNPFTDNSKAMAQNKLFTLEDLNFGGNNYRNMVPKNQYYTWWGEQLVRYDMEECYLVDKKTGKETLLFKLDDAKNWLKEKSGNKLYHLYYVSFPYADQPLVRLSGVDCRWLVNFKTGQLVWFDNAATSDCYDWSNTSRAASYLSDNQLCVLNGDGTMFQVSKDASTKNELKRNIVYGESVYRQEFGIEKGTFWSPDGQKLAFYRMDQTLVSDYPQVNTFERVAKYEPDKYPMAGEQSHYVTVGVYDINTKTTVYLKTPESTAYGKVTDADDYRNGFVYFTNVAWSPDGKTIYLFELNRDQNDCRLVSYDAQTGERKQELYRETSDKYVEPLHPIQFLPWDDNSFIMQSQKDGYNHLYLCTLPKNGGELKVKQLTSGEWVVLSVVGFDKKNKQVIITSNEISPIQCNTFAVNVKTLKRTLLDNGRGYHNPTLSENGEWIVDKYSEPTVPRVITVQNTLKPTIQTLFTAPNPWAGYDVPEYSCGTIKAADGVTDLYYRMVKPTDFDPNKKYPTIIYVYGGPHAHNVDARWNYCSRGWETYMAQKGYLIFILDNRGSENRGAAFEQATFRQLGQIEMQDQMQGVEYLKSLPYVDADRMGVHGWSFGGYMTITLMTNHPDVFKVGVAGGPVIDWKWYEVMYGERYMDTPLTNPEGYEKCSLIKQAQNLKGKLQIIIGMNDPTVVPQHALQFIHECNIVGTQPDFYVYPGEGHNMAGHQSTHLHERISQYFDDYLK